MYAYEREKIRKEQDELLKNSYSPNTIYIDNTSEKNDKRFVSMMSSMSHTYGNVLAWIQNYVLDLMPENLFKTIHVNSQIAHRQIRGTGHEILKKTKPMIIFRPRIGTHDEDRFLKGTPLIERQTDLYSTWGWSNLQPFFHDPSKDLLVKFQQNRSVMMVDVVMVFSTLMNQIDYVHYLENAIPWGHPRLIQTCLESYIPQEMLKIISDISHVPLYNQENSTRDFVQYLEQNSITPVTYKLQGSSGTREFYRYYPTNIDTLFTDLSWDEGEKVGHVMNSYQVTFSIRLEFYSTGFYYIFSDNIYDIKLPKIDMENSKVIPVFTDVLTKEDLNLRPGWHLYNKASCRLEKEMDSVCIDEMLNNSTRAVIKYHLDNGLPLVEFLDIKVRRQGKLMHEGLDYKIDYKTMTIYFNNKSTYFTYRILICVNVEYINDMTKTIYKLK